MPKDEAKTATDKTNGDWLTDLLRQNYAMQQPTMYIPAGVTGFIALSALSAMPLLPFAGAALIGYGAYARLKKSRRIVEKSYQGRTGKELLYDKLPDKKKEVVLAFSEVYPLDKTLGAKAEKKTRPLPPETTDSSRSPQSNQATTEEGTKSKVDESKPTSSIDEELSGWKPEDLPESFTPYLASQIHLLLAATTGSGKTHLLRSLCTYLSNKGHTLVIADPKGTQWGDLKPASLLMRSGIDYSKLLQDLQKELDKRIELLSQGKPVGNHIWGVFDEWMLFKGKCQTLDADGKAAIEQRLLNLIAAGRELNMHLIMVNQSHLLGDLSLSGQKNTFSSGLRDNLCTLGLGCKTTQDNSGRPMRGNSKSIDSMLQDRALLRDKADRDAAQIHHAELRRQGTVNRTFALYSSQLYIGTVPDLEISDVVKLQPFYPPKQTQESA